MILLALALAAASSIGAPPLPQGTGLPPPGTDEAAVMAPIGILLRALETDDGAAVLGVTLPEGSITAAQVQPDGTRRHRTVRWAEFAAGLKPDGKRVVERLGQPAIEFDEDVAMVWAPYTVTIDGKLSHCGYDLFDLVRVEGRWKILNVTYSHRTTGCIAQ